MEYKRYKLGDLITQRREKYEGDDIPIAGISRDGFMPPKQIEADTSIYNVFYLNDFVFNPARMELNSIVFNDVYPKAICSSLYEMFYVHRTDVIMPEYLNLYVKRDEFARHCEFLGSGSAREYCRVANISEIKLDIPSLEEQQKIVRQCKTITDRIEVLEKINKKLEKQAMLIYRDWFVDYGPFGGEKPGDWLTDTLGSFTTVKRGGSPRPIEAYISDSGYRWLKISDATDSNSPYIFEIKEHIKESGLKKTVYLNAGELVLSNSATPGLPKILTIDTCIHDGWLYFPEMNIPKEFMYLYFKWERENIVANANGSIFLNLKIDIVQNFEITMPNETDMKKFMSIIRPMFQQILVGANEIYNLKKLKTTILSNVI